MFRVSVTNYGPKFACIMKLNGLGWTVTYGEIFFFFNKKFKYIYHNLAAISSSNHIKMNFEGSLLAATLSNSDYGGVIGDDTMVLSCEIEWVSFSD